MASDWDNGDTSFDTFDNILSENPTFDNQGLDEQFMGLISQTTELNGDPYETSTTQAAHSHQPSTLPESQNTQPHSTVSSISPESSAHDSSSDSSGRRKRKGSSTSSPTLWPNMNRHMSGLKVSDRRRDEDISMSQTPRGTIEQNFGASPSASFPMSNNMEYSDKSMAGFFDIDSAAASPGAFGTIPDMGGMGPAESAVVSLDSKQKRTQTARPGAFFKESRDQSPLDGSIGMSQNVGSTVMFNPGPSPPGQYGLDSTWSVPPSNLWNPANYSLDTMNFSPSPVIKDSSLRPAESKQTTSPAAPQLYIDPTTRKSRVETQIPIKLTLSPLPEGVTKLHLPTHTIAKAKMLAKEVKNAPDTLELHVMLVCASAMKNEAAKQRAFRLASGAEPRVKKENPSSNRSSPQQGDVDDDPDKPLNGGEVRICKNCINREAKRAARKKIKSPDDESHWRQYENDRVVVFNTHEYKDWKPWEQTKPENVMDSPDQQQSMPEGSMMVEVPMRIACYCRHQGEKDGFQIIFTIKDSNDRLVAQNISEPILITDDHKTQPGSTMPDGSSSYVALPNAGYIACEQVSTLSRGYHSTPDLVGMQQHPQSFLPQQQLYHSSRLPSRNTSGAETPKNLSRPASPDGSSSGPNKKRKGSGSGSHRFSGLVMTPMTINTAQQAPPTSMPNSAGPAITTTNGHFPRFSPQGFSFPQTTEEAALDGGFSQPAAPSYFPSALPSRMNTRNESFGNNFYSAPTSQIPSRASSPISHRPNPSYQNILAQRVYANFNQMANPAITSPTEAGPTQAPPLIHKLSPAEGPVTGNIEISIYGSGFYPGLDVMFGHNPAISTTFWGDKALLCVLPPSPQPGPVTVTFTEAVQTIFSRPPSHTPPAIFIYRDDHNQEKRDLLEFFSRMVTEQGGYVPDDCMDYMQPYMARSTSSYRAVPRTNGVTQHSYTHSPAITVSDMLAASNNEGAILKFLELQNREAGHCLNVDLKRKDGSTLLSIACSKGYSRAVATLLSCHANPDTRDANGLTPLTIAAMRGHTQIVRLLLRKGADPTVRTLQGYTAAELASADEVRLALMHVPNHSRNSSGLRSMKSGRSSPDLRSLNSFYTTTDESGNSTDEEVASGESSKMRMRGHQEVRGPSRHPSRPHSRHQSRRNSLGIPSPLAQPRTALEDPPYAAMNVWRSSLSAQIQHFHENMQRNLPNFPNWQLPALPPLPNLPDYQDNAMMRRISSLVPNRHLSLPTPTSSSATSSLDETQRPPEAHNGFWDFFSSAAAPPSYEDLYPEKRDHRVREDKKLGAVEAIADAVLDQACAQKFDNGQSSVSTRPSSPETVTVTMGGGKTITREQQRRLMTVHAQKLQKRDNKLYYFWIPALFAILYAMVVPSPFQSLASAASSTYTHLTCGSGTV